MNILPSKPKEFLQYFIAFFSFHTLMKRANDYVQSLNVEASSLIVYVNVLNG